jgi:hypothetical protein
MVIEYIGILVSLIVIFFFVYLIIYRYTTSPIIEGLTKNNNNNDESNNNNDESNNTLFDKGEAGLATTYANKIKSKIQQLQKDLLIEQYKKDYENIIINLDDYVSYLMLKTTLNMDLKNDITKNMIMLNTLKDTKISLNDIMKFLDRN